MASLSVRVMGTICKSLSNNAGVNSFLKTNDSDRSKTDAAEFKRQTNALDSTITRSNQCKGCSKGYIRMDPDRVPIARRFWTGSYASAVGSRGKPCRTVWNNRKAKPSLVTMATRNNHGNTSAMDDQKQMSSKLMDVQILREAEKHFYNGKRYPVQNSYICLQNQHILTALHLCYTGRK